jgi:hypothetical protein
MFYNQSDTKFLYGNVHSMQCKKLNLKSNCIEFCNSTTYSIECKSDLGRLTVWKAAEVKVAIGEAMADTKRTPKTCQLTDILNCPGCPTPWS